MEVVSRRTIDGGVLVSLKERKVGLKREINFLENGE